MSFYQIPKPTTQQLVDAILERQYFNMDQLLPKIKQVNTYLKNEWNCDQVLITFEGVTNPGGYPIVFADNTSIEEVASEFHEDFYEWSDEDRQDCVELLVYYTRLFTDVGV